MALAAAKFGASVGQHPAQPDAVLVVERHHPVVEDLGSSDRRLAIIKLGEGDLGVGVDDGLLVDPPDGNVIVPVPKMGGVRYDRAAPASPSCAGVGHSRTTVQLEGAVD